MRMSDSFSAFSFFDNTVIYTGQAKRNLWPKSRFTSTPSILFDFLICTGPKKGLLQCDILNLLARPTKGCNNITDTVILVLQNKNTRLHDEKRIIKKGQRR
jgi:hypothetical protein